MLIFGAIMMLTPLLPTFRHFRSVPKAKHALPVCCHGNMCTALISFAHLSATHAALFGV